MRSQDNKILFAGPVGAGKTTAIAAISDIAPIRTDAKASDMTLHRKAHTTVALDYGMLRLDADTKVHLYGTPGQERFDFMWEIVSRGGIGLILLLDHSRANPMQDLAFSCAPSNRCCGARRWRWASARPTSSRCRPPRSTPRRWPPTA